jgi:hypothetical protein
MRRTTAVSLVILTIALFGGCVLRGSASLHTPPPPTVHVGATVGATVGTPAPAPVAPPRPTVVGVAVSPPRPTVVAGVTVMGSTCNPNAPEVLNGIDDNCNGMIDEGFVGTGTLQITLGWNTGADMDLYVVDPSGTEISYSNTRSNTGGYLDRDARGACTNGQVVENVFWENAPPAGHYAVRVHYYSACSAAGPTPFTVSVAFNGQIVDAYQFTATDGQTVPVFEFDL